MKKVITLIAFFMCMANIFGQEWAPIGAKWTYTFSSVSSSYKDTATMRVTNDTIIQGKTCRIMKKNYYSCNDRPIIEYTYADSGKVYFFDQSRNVFQMLYNFNASIGSTYKIYDSNYPNNDSVVLKVDSVSTVTINTYILKKLFVHQTNVGSNFPYVGGEIIENIGDLQNMFAWVNGACDATFAFPLRCYEDTVIGFHDFHTAPSCDFVGYVGLKEIKADYFAISPNPFLTFTQISFDKTYPNITLSLYDLQGKLLLQNHYTDCNQITLHRNQLSNGLYFLKLIIDDKQIETRKIVIGD